MRAIRGKDTQPEIRLRRALSAAGYSYRTNYRKVAGTPDVVMLREKLAIFVDGDFWHGRSWKTRGLSSLRALFPTRTDYWVQKITRNIARDKKVNRALKQSGWQVIRVWESDVLHHMEKCVRRISERLLRA